MDKTARTLKEETEKWLEKIKKEKIEPKKTSRELDEQITNIKAYISDCRHFLKEGDYVRAFEAVVYAWGILETCQRLGLLK